MVNSKLRTMHLAGTSYGVGLLHKRGVRKPVGSKSLVAKLEESAFTVGLVLLKPPGHVSAPF